MLPPPLLVLWYVPVLSLSISALISLPPPPASELELKVQPGLPLASSEASWDGGEGCLGHRCWLPPPPPSVRPSHLVSLVPLSGLGPGVLFPPWPPWPYRNVQSLKEALGPQLYANLNSICHVVSPGHLAWSYQPTPPHCGCQAFAQLESASHCSTPTAPGCLAKSL